MLIPNKFNGYVAGRRTYNTGMEPLLLGAAIGGGTSALRGGNPIQGALLGGLTGGIGSAASGALAGALGSGAAAPAAAGAEGALASGLTGVVSSPIHMGSEMLFSPLSPMSSAGDAATRGLAAVNPMAAPAAVDVSSMFPGAPELAEAATQPAQAAMNPAAAAQPASGLSFMGQEPGFRSSFGALPAPQASKSLADIWKALPMEKKLLYGGGGALGLMALMGQQRKVPGAAPYTGPLSRFSYNPSTYVPLFAQGGMTTLGSYSDGGRLLKGPGDGMSDNIPATIANKQPARLADGEFVIPADVVSHLGNGSTDAGAKQLYAMMDRIRAARTGTKKQGKQINPEQFMPTRTKRKVKRFNGEDGSNVSDSAGSGNPGSGGEDALGSFASGIATGQGDDGQAALGMYGFGDNAGYGGPDPASYGQGIDSLLRPEILADYKPQQQPSVNTNIYRPSYTNYATGPANAVSSYGQGIANPFTNFVNPFARAAAPGGIGAARYYPEFEDYGLSGLR